MDPRSPVITGLGIIGAPGCGVDEIWNAITANADGLRGLSLFQSPRYGQLPVGEVRRNLSELGAPRRGSRSDRLAWLAASQAIQQAGLDVHRTAESAGVMLGCSVGGSFDSERFLTRLLRDGKMQPRPTRFHECVSAVDLIADDFGFLGPSMALATACSSGALAIAAAAEMIQSGQADVMLAGGADSLSRMTWGGFQSLLLVDPQGCRPFDVSRRGMSLGEGAGALVIEAEETARRRGAKILARLAGWGASCDAYHVTKPHPEGAGAAGAMSSALRRARLQPSEIDYVNAHGTGTRDNDLSESKALATIFGKQVPPFSSTKRFFGHALAASGAMEAVLCVLALLRQVVPANPGFAEADPAIGLEPVREPRSARLTYVMSNSFGFGGNNAALIFSSAEARAQLSPVVSKPALITGVGVIGPGTVCSREIEKPLPSGKLEVFSCDRLPEADSFTPLERRRLSRMSQMAILAARAALPKPAPERTAVMMGTGLGCLEEGAVFIENLILKNEAEPMPSRFPASVHNAPAGQIATDLGARGFNCAPTAAEISFECALWLAMRQLDVGESETALAGAVDELNKYPLAIGKRWGFWNERTRPGEGAVTACLSHAASKPMARVTSVRLGRFKRPFDARREAEWIASAIDLSTIDVFLSGAGGWPELDFWYNAVSEELNSHHGRPIAHQTYKQLCGEFHSASAFGFSVAVDIAARSQRGVLLYTLSRRGGKSLCCVQP